MEHTVFLQHVKWLGPSTCLVVLPATRVTTRTTTMALALSEASHPSVVPPDEFRGVLCMLASRKNRRLRVNIPDTLFVSVEGHPLSRFTSDGKGGVAHHGADKLGADPAKTFGDFARACELFADRERRGCSGQGRSSSKSSTRGADADAPKGRQMGGNRPIVAVARFPAPHPSRLLTAIELRRLVEGLDARRRGMVDLPPMYPPGFEFLPPPYCVQAHVPPVHGARHVTTFSWADTAVVCETTTMSHAAMYAAFPDADVDAADGADETTTNGGGPTFPSATLARPGWVGGEGPSSGPASSEADLTLRTQTLRVVNHVATAHAAQLLGAVLEYVIDAVAGEPYLVAVLATCWPEPWTRHRATHRDGGGFGSPGVGPGGTHSYPALPQLASPNRPITQHSRARVDDGLTTRSPRRPGTSAAAVREPTSTVGGSLSAEGSGASLYSTDSKYGVNSVAAAVLAPRYSERGVWSRSHGPLTPAEEAMSRAAATVVRAGRSTTTYSSTSLGYTARGRHVAGSRRGGEPTDGRGLGSDGGGDAKWRGGSNTARASAAARQTPMVAQLTRRLEEVREALQEQTLHTTEATLTALRANEARVVADHAAAADRAEAAAAAENEVGLRRQIAEGEKRLREATAAWNQERAALEHNLRNVADAHDALKVRLDFERERFFTLNGDLQSRLDAVTEDYAVFKRHTDEAMAAFSNDALEGMASAETMRTAMETMRRDRDAAMADAADLSDRLSTLQTRYDAVCEQRDRLVELSDPDAAAADLVLREKIPIEYGDVRDMLKEALHPEHEFRAVIRALARKEKGLRAVFRHYAETSNLTTAASTRAKLSRQVEDQVMASREREKSIDMVYVPADALKAMDCKMAMHDFLRMFRDMELDKPGYGQPDEVGAESVPRDSMERLYLKATRSNGGVGFGFAGKMDFRGFLEALLRLARARYSFEHLVECVDVFLKVRLPCAKVEKAGALSNAPASSRSFSVSRVGDTVSRSNSPALGRKSPVRGASVFGTSSTRSAASPGGNGPRLGSRGGARSRSVNIGRGRADVAAVRPTDGRRASRVGVRSPALVEEEVGGSANIETWEAGMMNAETGIEAGSARVGETVDQERVGFLAAWVDDMLRRAVASVEGGEGEAEGVDQGVA